MKNKFYNYLKCSLPFVVFILISATAFSQPASCTAAIGTPANGLQHHITITWSAVAGASSYQLDYSTDNATWTTSLYAGTATTYDHDASNTGNVPFYYRVSSFTSSVQSAYTYATPFPVYTACDFPSTPTVTSISTSSVTVQLVPESPTPNSSITTYAIYCTTTGQYVQANGALGASAAWQTMATWGTVTVTGLTSGTSYCFYAQAMNVDSDVRYSTTTILTQTFDASSSVKINNVGSTASWWSPSTPTSGNPFVWKSTGGCSGGTGAGNIAFSGSFTNYFGDFIRSPATNCTGNTSVVMTFDLTNSYIASHIVSSPSLSDAAQFNMWVDNGYKNASSVKINGVEVSSVDGNGTWLKFDVARSCVLVSVTFDLTTSTNLSNILFYINADDPYNDSYTYSVNLDNVSLLGSAPTACATPSTCTATTVSSNPSSQTICAGLNTSFTVGTSGGAAGSYQWQVSTNSGSSWSAVSNGGVYSNATTATLNITNATSGMSGYEYRCSVTGSCSGTPTSTAATLTVNSTPGAAGTITGTATVCQGQTGVTYSISSVSGATSYTWSLPTGGSITAGSSTNSITVSYSGSAVSGNVNVTPTNTCGSGTAATAFAVTVNQTPTTPGAITGVTSPCSGTTNTYSIASVSGATSYTWTLPSGWTGASTSTSISATASSSSGTISVTANNTCGSSTAQTLAVTPLSIPGIPGAITGSSSPCVGVAGNYSVASVSGATSYTWTLPGGWSGTSTSDAISATPNSTSGTITVTANNTCGSSTAQTLSVTPVSAPSTPGSITGNTSPCSGATNSYSVASVSGATSYTWTLPNGWSGTSTLDAISATAGSSGGTISVTANNTCGSSTAQTLSVTVLSAPSTPGSITGSTSPCSGTTNNYSITAVNGATSYTWTLPGGWTGTSSSDAISAVAGSSGGTISVTANNTCGSSTAATLPVTVISIPPTPGSITGSATVCVSGSASYSVASITGATDYTWTLPNGWSGSSTSDAISAVAGSTGGAISVTANNTCGSSAAQTLAVTTASVPSTPVTINGPNPACTGGTVSYSVTAVTGATSYTWTFPNGWSGSSSSDAITVVAGSTGGTISVTANNTCGNSTAQTLAVSVASMPAVPGAISGPNPACIGSTVTYSIAPVPGTNGYQWTLPSGWTGNSTADAISVVVGSSNGTISVNAGNTCGSSQSQTLAVTAISTPATPGTISGPNPACLGSTVTYSVTGVASATDYTWNLPNGWTGNSTTDSITAVAGSTGGTITVTANNTCGNSNAATKTVTIAPALVTPGAITGADSVCSGTSQIYSIAPVSGASSYTWTFPNGWTGGSTADAVNVTAGPNSGNISVTANSACGNSPAQTLAVTANSAPATPGAISGPTVICSGTTRKYSIAPVANTNSYSWTIPNGWTGSSITDSIAITTNQVNGTISVQANNTCGSSPEQSLSVAYGALPSNNLTGSDNAICANDSSQICAAAGMASYAWNTGQTSSCIYASEAGNYYVTVTANNGCLAQSAHFPVSVRPVPSVAIIVTGDTLSSYGETSYQWYHNGNLIPGAHSQVYIADSLGNYQVQITDSDGCTALSNAVSVTSTGIMELQQSNVEVYPNPLSAGNWQLTVGTELVGSKVQIYDATGRLVFQSAIRDLRSAIPVNVLAGVYFLNIVSENKIVAVKKLVKVE